MDLILLRHGPAEAHAPDGSDSARALTARGRRKTRLAARGLARLLSRRPDAVLTSPRLRAAQTAQLLAAAVRRKPRPLPELAAADPDRILRALKPWARSGLVVVVGHEPTLGELAAQLCAGRASPALLTLKKAGACGVSLEYRQPVRTIRGRLAWLATPSMLRKLGR